MSRTTFARCFALLLGLLLLAPPALAAPPNMTRDGIIDIAKTGVGCPYVWGGTCWDPNNKSWKGADCSGYVTVCWQIPKASKTTDCLSHYYTTYSYYNQTTHWTNISRNDLQKADALVYRKDGAGHIVLYVSGDKWGTAEVYEARGTAYGIVHRQKTVSSSYVARKRNGLVTPPPPNQPPFGELESADCTAAKGYAQDPDEKTKGIEVHLYIDSTPGQSGAQKVALTANQNRQDLCSKLGSCNHGFTWTVSPSLRDGKKHTLRFYAIDTKGGQNPELKGSPKTITCAPPKPDGPLPKLDGTTPPPNPDAKATGSDLSHTDSVGQLRDANTPPAFQPTGPATLSGGCAVGSAAPTPLTPTLLLGLLLLARRPRRRR